MALFGGQKKKAETIVRPAPDFQPKLKAVTPSIERVNWLGLKVADVVGVSLFLEEKLGLKFLDEGNSAAGHHVLYDCETLQLELVEGGQTWATRAKPRLGHPDVPLVASFAVDKVQQIAEQLHEAEILTTQVFDQGWVASFLFFDIERNLWQVSETRNEPAVGRDTLRRIGAVWLAAEDLPAQVAFYRDVLGLPLSDLGNRPRPITEYAEREQATTEADLSEFEQNTADVQAENQPESTSTEIHEGATFFEQGARLVLSSGGHRLEGGHERQWGRDTSFMPGFQTNDLKGMAEKLRQAGVKLAAPDRTSRSLSRHRSFIRFTDPEGNICQISE